MSAADVAHAFVHVPRAPKVPEGHPFQRYFNDSDVHDRTLGLRSQPEGVLRVDVYRSQHRRVARVTFDMPPYCSMGGDFTAAELRDFAQSLLDAAHDLDTVPCVPYERPAQVSS